MNNEEIIKKNSTFTLEEEKILSALVVELTTELTKVFSRKDLNLTQQIALALDIITIYHNNKS
jgi:hypothetical protein